MTSGPRRAAAVAALGALVAGTAACEGTASHQPLPQTPSPTVSVTLEPSAPSPLMIPERYSDVVTGLNVPWDLAVLPDGSQLVTLRDEARVLHIVGDQATSVPADNADGRIASVVTGASHGLRGIALDPDYGRTGFVFVYLSTKDDDRVVRFTYTDQTLREPTPVLTGIPNAGTHTGGRLRFGPDRMLYVGIGDPGGGAAQDPHSLGGKILRVRADGSIPENNPFPGFPTWSYGHRNPQGFDWDPEGRLYASEFGQNHQDELNLIEPGLNYGWPYVEGTGGGSGYADPVLTWSPADSSPSGITVSGGTIYVAALRGERLWQVPTHDGHVGIPLPHLKGVLGRLRAVEAVPDGSAPLVLTQNTHGGSPRDGDDRLVRIILALQ